MLWRQGAAKSRAHPAARSVISRVLRARLKRRITWTEASTMPAHTHVVGARPSVAPKALGAFVAAALASVAFACPADAAPTITEYTSGLTPNLSPMQATQGPDG